MGHKSNLKLADYVKTHESLQFQIQSSLALSFVVCLQ